MLISRRGLIGGLASFLAAPAIVRASSLMPVKGWDDVAPALTRGLNGLIPGREHYMTASEIRRRQAQWLLEWQARLQERATPDIDALMDVIKRIPSALPNRA